MSSTLLRLVILLFSSVSIINLDAQLIQSEGMIQTTSGGIQFPDSSIQNTSAYHNGPHDASTIHAVGYMQIAGIQSELDTLDLANAIPVYAINFSGGSRIGIGRTRSAPEISALCVYTDIGQYTPSIWEKFAIGQVMQTAEVVWTRQPSSTYYKYNLENVRFQSVKDEMVHIGKNAFAHLQGVCLLPETIEWVYFDGQREFSSSYDITANTSAIKSK